MEGQLRPGLRADEEEVVMVVVLELTVVLEEDEVVAGAVGACTNLADESRCIFSTLTAGERLEEKVTEMRRAAGRGGSQELENDEAATERAVRDKCAHKDGAGKTKHKATDASFFKDKFKKKKQIV